MTRKRSPRDSKGGFEDLYDRTCKYSAQRQLKMVEKIKKKLQEESDKVKAQEAKLGKEISDAGDKLKAKLRKGVQVDDNATPPD